MESFSSDFFKTELHFRLMKMIHYLLSLVLFGIGWQMFRYGTLKIDWQDVGFRYNVYAVLLYAFLLFFFDRTYNAYMLGYARIRNLVFAQSVSHLFSMVLVYLVSGFAWNQFEDPYWFFPMMIASVLMNMLWSYGMNSVYLKKHPPKSSILLYNSSADLCRLKSLEGKPLERMFDYRKELCCRDMTFPEIRPYLEEYDAVFVSGLESSCRNGIIKYCSETGKDGFFLPHVGDVLMKGAAHIQSFSSPVLYSSRHLLSPEYAFMKRAFDIIASGIGIVVLSPLMLVTAIAIKAYDRGPVFYRQTRLTKDGKEFRIFKFRSMITDAEKDGKARLSTGENDERVTPVGRIVRRCRLDELPQLFNILKGDMSIVGPRPERPEIAEKYYETLPDFKLRLQVKAGLTGYAQVYGKYNTEPYEKLQFDLLYINRMSVLTDLRMMFATVGILFKKESTEGVEEGQTTAIGTFE